MTNLPPRQTRYFVAGGALSPNVPSYVERSADSELYEKVRAGDFCYVLTPRQMGKSSLMVRTARRLQQEGTHTVIIDLTEIGSVSVDKWYLGLLTKLQRDLKISSDVKSWWQEHEHLGAPQRLHQFLVDVVLLNVAGNIVIFIDEIDSTLNLDFRDDFFAVIRALYNSRAHNPDLARVTFVLLGVASPSELIEDRLRTPFNIGYEINLKEFNRQDAQVLLKGLMETYAENGQAIFERIFYWTNGHPYLTQQLCVHITENQTHNWNDVEIDRLVNRLFLQDESRGETNIQFVSDRILKSPQRANLLKLYKQVYKGNNIPDNKQSNTQSQLLLSGLVKIQNRHLIVSNHIYRQAFDQEWINKETAINWTLWVIGVLVFIIALSGSFLTWELMIMPERADDFAGHFHDAEEASTRTFALVKLLQLEPQIRPKYEYEHRARDLYFDPRNNWEDQSTIFNPDHFKNPEDLSRLIESTYIVLADVDNSGDTTRLLRMINDHLGKWFPKNDKLTSLQNEIQAWMEGREEFKKGNYDLAQTKYAEAIGINPENPATHFELARVYIFKASDGDTDTNYHLALVELDKVVEISFRLEPETNENPVPPVPTSATTNMPIPSVTKDISTPSTLSSEMPEVDMTLSAPTFADLATPTLQFTATATLISPSPTPNHNPVIPNFITRNERVVVVVNLLRTYPALRQFAQQANDFNYTNLRSNGFISTLSTSTPLPPRSTPNRTPAFIVANELTSEFITDTPNLSLTNVPIQTNTSTPVRSSPTIDRNPEIINIGQSVLGTPIEAVRIGTGDNAIIFIGGLHAGFAPATVLLAQTAIDYFANNSDLIPDTASLYIIPNANPDSLYAPGELAGRLNANNVDLNRNWGCRWEQDAKWRGNVVVGSGGSAPFSEPETQALSNFIVSLNPQAVVFWEARATNGLSAAGACQGGSKVSQSVALSYGIAAGYPVEDFESLTNQVLNGDGANWVDDQGIPSIAILLPEYTEFDWDNNRVGMLATLDLYGR